MCLHPIMTTVASYGAVVRTLRYRSLPERIHDLAVHILDMLGTVNSTQQAALRVVP
jgi:hypothetical protein